MVRRIHHSGGPPSQNPAAQVTNPNIAIARRRRNKVMLVIHSAAIKAPQTKIIQSNDQGYGQRLSTSDNVMIQMGTAQNVNQR
jgi:hypothetical protein